SPNLNPQKKGCRWMQPILDAAFAHPRGLFGRLGGIIMARAPGRRNAWTLSLLPLLPHADILEVGTGPGALLATLANAPAPGHITELDPAPTMRQPAIRGNHHAIQTQLITVLRGGAVPLPFADMTFDGVFSANSIFFWAAPLRGPREIQRVLKPAGELALI